MASGPQLVVMAAGIGSRYGGLKQIDPVGPSGEIVLDYAIFDGIRAGFERVVFIIRKEIEEAFRDVVGKTIEGRVEVDYAFQTTDALPAGFSLPPERSKPWGTAHAVLCAKDVIDSPFAVINADDFYGRQSFKLLTDHLNGAKDADGVYDYCMVGFVLSNTLTEHGHVARGVCTTTAEGYLEAITERTRIKKFDTGPKYSEDDETWTDLPADSVVSMNMWGLTPSYLAELDGRFAAFLQENINVPKAEFFLPTVINDLLAEGKARVKVLPTGEKWLGVTYRQDKPKVKQAVAELIRDGVYPQSLWGK